MSSAQLSDVGGRGWVNLRAADVRASGVVMPRLWISLYAATTREKRYADIHVLRGKLALEEEVLAEGFATGVSLNSYERAIPLELPISREALQYVTDHASGNRIDLTLDVSGWLEVRREPTEDEPTYLGEYPTPGERGFISFGQNSTTRLTVQVARSDWFTSVMEPVGTLSYVVTEIPLPKGGFGTSFQATLNQLREAEQKYSACDDAGVFFRCRAAVEALPGSPKNIFDPLPDRNEAECMNALLKETVDYLHRGSHTEREGERRGEFTVDHADARFALALTRLLVAQTSRLLGSGAS